MSEHHHLKAEPQTEREDRDLAAWSLLAGVLLLAVLAGPFLAGRIYTGDDLGQFHLPLRAFYAKQLALGESYDWMPGLFSGFYLTGEGQAGMYHPLHQLLYRLFPLRAALGLECLLSYPFLMAGTWFWLRRRLGRRDAAMFGALAFTFSGFNLLHFVHPNAVAVIAHIPWLLWAIDIVLTDSRQKHVALASAAIAVLTGSQLLLGYPQYVWFSLLAEAAYAWMLLATHKFSPRIACNTLATCRECVGCATPTWPRLVIAKEIGLLIGGVQLLPTLDAWLHSARASAGAGFASWGSLHPLNLLQLVAPYLFAGRVVGDNAHEFSLYVGAVPLLLAIWAIARRRELGNLASFVWAAAAFALVVLTLAFGRYGVLQEVVDWLPLVRSFRLPCRYLMLFQLAVAALAAMGFCVLLRENALARKHRRPEMLYRARHPWQTMWYNFEPLWCVVGVSIVVAGIGLSFRQDACISSTIAILAGPMLLMAAAVLIALVMRGYRAALVGLIVLTAIDLGWYGLSDSVYSNNARLGEYVAGAVVPPGKPDGRVVGSLLRFDQPGLRTGDLMSVQGWNRADGYAGIEPRRVLNDSTASALRVSGVRWVKRSEATDQIGGLKPRDKTWLEVPSPLPRARMMVQAFVSAHPAHDMAILSPDKTAFVEKPLPLPWSTPGKATIVVDRPGFLEIAVDCPAAQLLAVAESYHDGWRAEIDDAPQSVLRVNGDFMGCVVPAGKHVVRLTFQPKSLGSGWLASCLGLCMISLCFLGVRIGNYHEQ